MDIDFKIKYFYQKALIHVKNEFSTFFFSSLGILIYTIGVIGFTVPYHFPDSGVMGIALIFKYTMGFSPALFTLLANAVLVLWGGRELSKRFILWTIYNIILLSFLLEALSGLKLPHIDDMFLVSVASGIIKGLGIGMVFRTGTCSGGLDIVTAVLRKRYGVEVGKYGFYINTFIISASYGTVGLEKVLFGFVATYISGQTLDNVLASFDKRRLIFVISAKEDEAPILKYVTEELGRGATIIESRGGYTGEGRTNVMCLLSPRQTMELKRHLAQSYPKSFMVVSEASEVLGRGFKRWKNI
ncbi:MAG: YitT family protein [Synergistaceae bacterium]|nr:YitT family protein [Synergistaceae bacterium]